jgi:hypothetical protein
MVSLFQRETANRGAPVTTLVSGTARRSCGIRGRHRLSAEGQQNPGHRKHYVYRTLTSRRPKPR